MITERNQLFRKTALERLASPDQLDERLTLVSYRPWIKRWLPALVVVMAGYLVWIAGAL
ncbi:MAG: hypothetical protein H7232_10120 [Aeromicrobium sp.]|nr:hypothetical protein [Burkholderiales bacterium]